MSGRAAVRLDSARRTLLALAGTHPDDAIREQAARAATRLIWAGSWLDVPYRPADASPSTRPVASHDAARWLHECAEAFDELLEDFESDDPVANANGVQTSCLAFAIVGATAAYLDRREQARAS